MIDGELGRTELKGRREVRAGFCARGAGKRAALLLPDERRVGVEFAP